jgi:hypothetical protein
MNSVPRYVAERKAHQKGANHDLGHQWRAAPPRRPERKPALARTRSAGVVDREVDDRRETIPAEGGSPLQIRASDIYEWVSGRFFVVHTAYGRIGDQDVGGIEMIGYDPEAKMFRTQFFDSEGNITAQDLKFESGTWTWSGHNARATGVLREDGRAMPTLHEWSDDGVNWRPSMNVTLWKVV